MNSVTDRCIEQSETIFGLRGEAESKRSAQAGFHREQIFPGLMLTTFVVDPGGGLEIDFSKPDNIFEIGFVLTGKTRTRLLHCGGGDELELGPDSVIAHYLPNIPARLQIQGKEPAQMLGIEMELSLLHSFLESDHNVDKALVRVSRGGTEPFQRYGGMSALQLVAANQILSCPFGGAARSLFLQGKVLELLAYQLDDLNHGRRRFSAVLNPEDVRRIHRAREILRENMAFPPSLADLATVVGVNTNKLKLGFKSVYGKTAFGCLHEDRMYRAQALIQERRLNISQVAWDIGYTNVGHFSVAFRKFFGVKPKDFRADSGRRFHCGCRLDSPPQV